MQLAKFKSNKSSTPNLFWRLVRRPSGAVGFVLVSLFVLIAVLGYFNQTPFDPIEQNRIDRLQAPNEIYIMGTDLLGRDIASRLIKGASNSLYVAVMTVMIATIVGTAIGATSGFIGGMFDTVIMRIMDVFFAFPAILLALLIVTVLGSSINNTILAITIVYTPIFARVARGPVLSVKQMEYIMASRCLGASPLRLLLRHVLPNSLAPIIVQISLALSWALLTEAALSFLGLGTPPPEPSWGAMLSDSRGISEIAPWLMTYPAIAIILGVLGFNLLGDGLRDALDTHSTS